MSLLVVLQHKYRDLMRLGVESVATCSPRDFSRHYLLANIPVVLRSAASSWQAVALWNPAWFREWYGREPVEVMAGRSVDRNYEAKPGRHRSTMPFSDFIDSIVDARSNDRYLVGKNNLLAKPAFEALWNHVGDMEGILDPSRCDAKHVQLWLGPGGSTTPLHHDLHDVLVVQVFGRKRILLTSPFELEQLDSAHRNLAKKGEDLEALEETRARTRSFSTEVLLSPGDALLVPIGWWHAAENLELSISLSMQNLASAPYHWSHPDFGG